MQAGGRRFDPVRLQARAGACRLAWWADLAVVVGKEVRGAFGRRAMWVRCVYVLQLPLGGVVRGVPGVLFFGIVNQVLVRSWARRTTRCSPVGGVCMALTVWGTGEVSVVFPRGCLTRAALISERGLVWPSVEVLQCSGALICVAE